MTSPELRPADILRGRLRNQWLVGRPSGATAADVVRRLGAVQAQDYGGARWAIAQRAAGLTGADIDQELADGSILRTHVLRPTWHLVIPADIRWMLALTAPRVRALMAYGDRLSGLDEATFSRSNRAIAAALSDGRHLTRLDLAAALRRAGIDFANTIALGHLVMRAELDGVVCSGALRGKQHTYALLDARAPAAGVMDRDAALAALAGRYFAGHGPATIRDFAWWSGLSMRDATAGVKTTQPPLQQASFDGTTYWFEPDAQGARRKRGARAHLLPNFDEYTVGYADRDLLRESFDFRHFDSRGSTIFTNVVMLDGRVMGRWQRTLQKVAARVVVTAFRPLDGDERADLAAAAERYGRFLELPTEVDIEVVPDASIR